MLSEAAACLGESGVVIIHDFFFEHFPEKSALFDMNMFINTYNGRVFSWLRVREELERWASTQPVLSPSKRTRDSSWPQRTRRA